MSLSKLKERLKHYKSLQNLNFSHQPECQEHRVHDHSCSTALKISKARCEIENRLVTEINEKIVTSKEELKKYAKILKINQKIKKSESKSKVIHSSKTKNQTISTNKKQPRDKIMSPIIPKLKPKKEFTEIGSLISHHGEKEKKKLRKCRQQTSHTKWKFESTEYGGVIEKVKMSKSRQRISRKKSPKKIQKIYTEVSLNSTPSSLMTDEVQILDQIGQGTFGKVFRGRLRRSKQIVAVKRVLQDSRYRNREIQIVKMLCNDFICQILGTYITHEGKHDYLNILMRYYEQNLYQKIKSYPNKMPKLETKIVIYQLFKGLSYLHSLNICHRDIKPENILLKGNNAVICDFGSAKVLMPDESNISYICARCYRAPELIFGAMKYTTQVDIWSAGCVILEILNEDPLFIGQTSITHLLQIIKILGTPSPEEVLAMNPEYDIRFYKFPMAEKKKWEELFPSVDPLLLKLIKRIMVYTPKERATAIEVLSMDYFDELRDQLTYSHISSMYHLRNFFAFSRDELVGNDHLKERLIPKWAKQM